MPIFADLKVGDEFRVINKTTGETNPELPIITKIKCKILEGKRVNARFYKISPSGEKIFEYVKFKDICEIKQVLYQRRE
jgi:hypothetical protein